MIDINEILNNKEIVKIEKSERAELMKQVYEIYTSPHERILRKKENWKRYIFYLKENRIKNSKEEILKFKKQKQFIKEYPVKTLCFFLSHIKTKDFYFLLSEMRDKKNRGFSASAYLFYSTQWMQKD